MPRVAGSRKIPACVTDAPKPTPPEAGSSTNSGMRTNELYIPKPRSKPVRFVVQTACRRIIRMRSARSSRSVVAMPPSPVVMVLVT